MRARKASDFSRNAVFCNPTEHFSSVDSILLIQTAVSALVSIEVDCARAKKHAPIVAEFVWPKIFVEGTVLRVPAPLDLGNLPQLSDGNFDLEAMSQKAEAISFDKFHSRCQTGDDDHDWEVLHDFALESLTSCGAKFKPGLATRAKKPALKTCKPCAGQFDNGCAITKNIAELELQQTAC